MTNSEKNALARHNTAGISVDKKLGKLLNAVVTEVKTYAEDQIKHIRKLSDIGIALSLEKDINTLFEMIVEEAKSLCNADAGTLYIVDDARRHLRFVTVHNDSLKTRDGGFSEASIPMAGVPLYIDGLPNHSNVSSLVALTGEPLNIPNIYQAEKIGKCDTLDFSGTKKYDKTTGYHTRSMLVIPMKNHEGTTIGVLQLLNAQDRDTKQIIPFPAEDENLIASLASQAAVALTNVQLIKELKDLFYAFIKSIATAIDEKSPYTGGHINRVVELTMMIAETINACNQGAFKDVFLNEEEKEELLIAAWMHDVGKITTPEHVVDKATKLETIFDRVQLIASRFACMEQIEKNKLLEQKISLLTAGNANETAMQALENEYEAKIRRLREDFALIESCNNTGEFMTDEKLARLEKIAKKTYQFKGEILPVLSKDEMENLSVRRGTLTDRERKIIENHSLMTYKITRELPFPKHLSRVPEFAAQHHEKLNGSGYPKGLSGKALSLQSRILAVADIFDALTAKDRPYKSPMGLSQVIKILGFMKNDRHLDADIVDLFLETNRHLEYAKAHLNPEQIDL